MAKWFKKIFSKKETNEKTEILDAKQIAKLYYLATVDTKTQLYNYRYFNSLFKREMAIAERYHRTISMLLIDIDDFKKINDKFGYLQGDEVLKRISVIIKSITRETDVAARFGGEEFIILMSETSLEEAKKMAERVRKSIEEDAFLKPFNVTVSVGIASHKKPESEVKARSRYKRFISKTKEKDDLSLFQKTNLALKYAKENNKNICIAYEDVSKLSFFEEIKSKYKQ